MQRLVLLTALLLGVGAAHAAPDEAPGAAAGRYTDPGHDFSLLAPPGYERLLAPPANIRVQWVDQRRSLSLAVAWARMDTTAWKGTSKLTLRVALEAGMRLSTKGFRKIAGRSFEHHDLPGYEIEYEFAGDGGGPLRTLMRYYFTGDGQFMAMAMGPPADFEDHRAELVAALDSLEVTRPWKGGWGGKGGVGPAQAGALIGIFLVSIVAVVIWLVARGAGKSRPPAPRGFGGPYGPGPYGPGPYGPPGAPPGPYGPPGAPPGPYGPPGAPPGPPPAPPRQP